MTHPAKTDAPGTPLPIDTARTYRTRAGKTVVLHDFVPRNSAGALVTFPVKGTIIRRDTPRRSDYQIWTRDGRADALSTAHPDDLVDFPTVPDQASLEAEDTP